MSSRYLFDTRERNMASRKPGLLVAAFVVGVGPLAHAQGTGGGACCAGGAGTAGASGAGAYGAGTYGPYSSGAGAYGAGTYAPYSTGSFSGAVSNNAIGGKNAISGTTISSGSSSTPKRITNYFTPADPSLIGANATTAGQKSSAINGTNTAPQAATATTSGAVSAPGVGVGHAANGQPIGTTGSGLGSPENPIGSNSR
jgi:hypothetical protein